MRFGILKTCFIDELHIDKSHCLTCNVHNSALEYSIIKRYTNAVYYYYYYLGCFCFTGELGFLDCDDICMCVVNKYLFNLLE